MTERPRTYLQRDERRQALVELGMRLFSSRSYEDVSIDDVAREGGVSKGLLYHYFGGKRAYYTEVVRQSVDQLLQRLILDPAASGPENLRRGLLSWFEFIATKGEAYLAIMRGGGMADDAVGTIIEDARRVICDRILDSITREEAPAVLRIAVRSWLGAVETAAQEWATHGEPEPLAIVDVMTAGLFAQLLAASQHAPKTRLTLDIAAGMRMLAPLFAANTRT